MRITQQLGADLHVHEFTVGGTEAGLASCGFVDSTGRSTYKMALSGLSLNQDRYVGLLRKLIGETKFLQDNPPKFVPEEDK